MRGEKDEGHGGCEGEVGGVGVIAPAQEIAAQPHGQHAEGSEGKGAAEETHGRSGEVEDVAEGEVVDLGTASDGEEGDDVGAGCGMGGGEGEVSADDGDDCGEGDEEVEMPGEGAAADVVGCVVGAAVGAGEEAAGHERKGWNSGERVVLLTVGDAEEADYEDGPEGEGECGFMLVRVGGGGIA